MNFQLIKDDYYSTIPEEVEKRFPSLNSDFDRDQVYLVLDELWKYFFINEPIILDSFMNFINFSFEKGKSKTEDAFVIQVFERVEVYPRIIDIFKKYLTGRAAIIFAEFLNERSSRIE